MERLKNIHYRKPLYLQWSQDNELAKAGVIKKNQSTILREPAPSWGLIFNQFTQISVILWTRLQPIIKNVRVFESESEALLIRGWITFGIKQEIMISYRRYTNFSYVNLTYFNLTQTNLIQVHPNLT